MYCFRQYDKEYCHFDAFYVYNNNLPKEQNREMNKIKVLVVFLCGILFALFSESIYVVVKNICYFPSNQSSASLAPNGYLKLLDDGYLSLSHITHFDEEFSLARKQSTDLEDKHVEFEALSSVKASAEMLEIGKNSKAGRLLEHAYSLAPHHPDILLSYGEFLEHHDDDIIQADHLYLRALTISPTNARALGNLHRTRSVVDELDRNLLNRINSKREELLLVPSSSGALRRIKKEAYIQQIYHTVGIEGNTMSLAQTRMILETRLSVGGYPPVIIRKQDRMQYYDHLQTANNGDTRPFIRFVANCAEKTLDVYLWATKEHLPEITQSSAASLKSGSVITERMVPKLIRNSDPEVNLHINKAIPLTMTKTFVFDSEDDSGDGSYEFGEPLWLTGKEELNYPRSGRFSGMLPETQMKVENAKKIRKDILEME